jgi:hypothetical protein
MSCVTTTASGQPASVIIPLLDAYSAITQTYHGTVNGTTSSFTASYSVVYASSTTYKVDITDVTPTSTYHPTVWLLKDGTVEALQLGGHNYTGSSAGTEFQTYFYSWENELQYLQQVETPSSLSFFHSTGTSMVTAGPSEFSVANYTANSLPETVPLCNGESFTFSTANISLGMPNGASYQIAPYVDLVGTETNSETGLTTIFNFVADITSVTVA